MDVWSLSNFNFLLTEIKPKSPAEGVQSTQRCATFRGEKFSVIVHNDENVIAIFSRQENATLFASGGGGGDLVMQYVQKH
jgi:hypothetical protein